MNKKISVFINAGSNLAINFGVNLLSFFTLPLYLTVFGKAEYGIFLLAFGVASSLVFFDFGIGSAIVKYTAKEGGESERPVEYLQFMNWSLRVVVLLAALFASLNLLLAYNVGQIFKLDAEHWELGKTIFQYFSMYTFLYCVFRQGQYYLEGKNQYLLINKIKLITLMGLLLVFAYVYCYRPNIAEFSLAFMLVNIIPYTIFFCLWLLDGVIKPKYWRSGYWFSMPTAHYLGFTKNLFIIQLTSFLAGLADKFIIGAILGPVAVVYYIAVTKMAYMVRMVNNQSLLVLNPLIAAAKAPDSRIIGKILNQGSVTQFILMLPICVVASFLLDPFLGLWLGEEFQAYSHWGVLALTVYVLGPFSAMTQRVMRLAGYDSICMRTNVALVGINLVVSIVFTFVYGIGGPIIGTVVQATLAIAVFGIYRKKYFFGNLGEGYRVMFKSAVFSTFCGAWVLWIMHVQNIAIDEWLALIMLGAVVSSLVFVYPAITLLRHPVYRLTNVRAGKV